MNISQSTFEGNVSPCIRMLDCFFRCKCSHGIIIDFYFSKCTGYTIIVVTFFCVQFCLYLSDTTLHFHIVF